MKSKLHEDIRALKQMLATMPAGPARDQLQRRCERLAAYPKRFKNGDELEAAALLARLPNIAAIDSKT